MQLKKELKLDKDRVIEVSTSSRVIISHFRELTHKKVQTKFIVNVHEPIGTDEIEIAINKAFQDFMSLWNRKTRRPHSLFIMLLLNEIADIVGQRLYKLDVKIAFIDTHGKMKEINVNSFLKEAYRYRKWLKKSENKNENEEEEK